MSYTISPLRYPGGKTTLAQFLMQVLLTNNLSGIDYAEPYAGGAGAALTLLQQEAVRSIRINDADPLIYHFWTAMLQNPEEFSRRIFDTKLTIEEWDRQKNIVQNANQHCDFNVGFAVFYLNRCNHSGILRASPIGGRRQSGRWGIDARFNRNALIAKVHEISALADKINVSNLDALEFLSTLEESDCTSFVFLDPPYYKKGKSLYLNYYKAKDHCALSQRLMTYTLPWIMTYDDAAEIRNLYTWCNVHPYSLNHSAQTAKKGKELLIRPNHIAAPGDPIPRYIVLPPAQSTRNTCGQAVQC